MFGGAGSFRPAGRLQGSHLDSPGRSLRPRLLAGGAAEHRLLRGVLAAATEGPQGIHAAALGLSLRYCASRLSPHWTSLLTRVVALKMVGVGLGHVGFNHDMFFNIDRCFGSFGPIIEGATKTVHLLMPTNRSVLGRASVNVP